MPEASKTSMWKSVAKYIYVKNEPYVLNTIFNLHMPSRLLYHYIIAIKALLQVRQSREQKGKEKKQNNANSFATPSRSISRPLLLCLEADTNAYWKVL